MKKMLFLFLALVFMGVGVCNALTEPQLLNRLKAQEKADYVGNSVDKENDGAIRYKSVKTYSKYDKNGEKAIRVKEHKYIVTPDAKAWEIK